jgi:hypothetical protein
MKTIQKVTYVLSQKELLTAVSEWVSRETSSVCLPTQIEITGCLDTNTGKLMTVGAEITLPTVEKHLTKN